MPGSPDTGLPRAETPRLVHLSRLAGMGWSKVDSRDPSQSPAPGLWSLPNDTATRECRRVLSVEKIWACPLSLPSWARQIRTQN